jgi:hypothetical protein
MNLNGTAVLDWTRCRRISVHARRSLDKHVDCGLRNAAFPERNDVAALCSVLANREIRQIHRCAHSRLSDLEIAAVVLNGTNPS